VKRYAVFVATTGGPAQVQRITRERAPLSMVVLGRGSERLPVSDRYDDFVHPGSGPVERFFGPFPEGGFRLEVSGPIDSGDSWQLGVFVAHAIQASDGFELVRDEAALETEADAIVWLTGQVDYDGRVSGVGHMQEKLQGSRDALATWLATGMPVSLVVAAGTDHDRLLACEPPTDAHIVAAADAMALCRDLGLDPTPAATRSSPGEPPAPGPPAPAPPPARRVGGRFLVPILVILLAGSLALLAATGRLGEVTAWPKRLVALLPGQPEGESPDTPPPKPRTPDPPPVAEAPQPTPKAPEPTPETTEKTTPAPSQQTKAPKPAPQPQATEPALAIAVRERRAPAGASCAGVHFGDVVAVEQPVDRDDSGQPTASRASGLCGLLLIIDAGPAPRYIRAKVTVLQGRLIGADRPPEALSGHRPVSGPQPWPVALPHRLKGPVRYQVTAEVSEKRPVSASRPDSLKTATLAHVVMTE
jgi:hypothetical protein